MKNNDTFDKTQLKGTPEPFDKKEEKKEKSSGFGMISAVMLGLTISGVIAGFMSGQLWLGPFRNCNVIWRDIRKFL